MATYTYYRHRDAEGNEAEFVDRCSGMEPASERPAWCRLMAIVEKGDRIILEGRPSILGRSLVIVAEAVHQAEQHGAFVESTDRCGDQETLDAVAVREIFDFVTMTYEHHEPWPRKLPFWLSRKPKKGSRK